jgi:hypothetical protein
MAILRIPPSHRSALVRILNLEDREISELASALEGAPPAPSPSDLVAALPLQMASGDEDDLKNMVGAILSLYAVRASLEASVPRLVGDIIAAMERSGLPDLTLTPPQQDEMRRRLEKLLSVPGLDRSVKAFEVAHEYDHNFCSARILSDIRPIFGPDPAARPEQAAIIHALRVTYHQDDRLRDFYVSMTDRDLDVLAGLIDRAREKAKALRAILDTANIPHAETNRGL